MIRIEFWNGHISNKKRYEPYGGHVTTNHNPCLWANHDEDDKPHRAVYNKALEFLDKYKDGEISATELLHGLRYVAYGYSTDGHDKREYDNADVVWTGNLTTKHRPKVAVKDDSDEYTIDFYFDGDENDKPSDHKWKTVITKNTIFYWDL